jgi:hypothetical protein
MLGHFGECPHHPEVLRLPLASRGRQLVSQERFGLADYRVQSYEAILRWHALVFAAYAFVQYRRVRPLLTNPKATLPELPEVLAAHQHGHLRQTVCYIAALARRGQSDAKILADLMPT